MLKVIGSMSKIVLARDEESMATLRASAGAAGSTLGLEQRGNILFGRAIFMGYDLPNGNGDAIPSFWSKTFGPSFVGKHLDFEHREDEPNLIGSIYHTWHIENEIPVGEGPRVIGRNAFGRDIAGRKPLFRLDGSQGQPIQGSIRELQVEGIFGIDRDKKMGDIVARRLLSGEMDSVSQEASTAYCQCSVCAHKIAFPFDPICDHLVSGHLMLRSWKVQGYDEEILGYKVHHEPTGTGLGVVQVPAFDRAKVAEMSAALKSGQMSIEAAYAMIREYERMVGGEADKNLIASAQKDFNLILKDSRAPKPLITGGKAKTDEDLVAEGWTRGVDKRFNALGDPILYNQETGEIRTAQGDGKKKRIKASEGGLDAYHAAAQAAGKRPSEIATVDAGADVGEFRQFSFDYPEQGGQVTVREDDQDRAMVLLETPDGESDDVSLEGFERFVKAALRASKISASGDFMDDEEHPFVVYNNYDGMPAFPNSFATVEEALAAATEKMKGWESQGYYKTNDGLRVPYESLTVGVAYEGTEAPEDFTLAVIDDRNEGGWVKRDAEAAPAVEASIKAGSECTVTFSKKDNNKGPEDDEVEVTVKPASDAVATVLESAGFSKIADGAFAMFNTSLDNAKEVFRRAVATQDKGRTGISIMEESEHAFAVDHIAPREDGQPPVEAAAERTLSKASSARLFEVIAAAAPAESDDADALVRKVHSAAVIEARLNRETQSIVRHAAIAAGLEAHGPVPAQGLVATAARAAELADLQESLDRVKAAMAARTGLELPRGAGEGSVPAWTMAHVAASLRKARFGSPRFESARIDAERAMPSVAGFHARLDAARFSGSSAELRSRIQDRAALTAARADFDELCRRSQAEAKKPGSFGSAKMQAAAASLAASLERLAAEELEIKFSMPVLAAADTALGRQSPAFAARRLRLPGEAAAAVKAASRAYEYKLAKEGDKVLLRSLDRDGKVLAEEPFDDEAAAIKSANEKQSEDGVFVNVSRAALATLAAHTADHLRKSEKEAAQAIAAGAPKDSAQAQAQADAMQVLASGAYDFGGSLLVAARGFHARSTKLSASLLAGERAAAERRVLTAAWTRAYDLDPSASPSAIARQIALDTKTPVPSALAAGIRLRSAGGAWPWTSQNGMPAETWPSFIEARSDQELEDIAKEWEGRLKAAVGVDARMVIESNVRRLKSVLDSRKQARGCSAALVGSPDPRAAYWVLKAADGSVLLRATVRSIVGARKDDIAVKWASSAAYGERLVAAALAFGVRGLSGLEAAGRRISAAPLLNKEGDKALRKPAVDALRQMRKGRPGPGAKAPSCPECGDSGFEWEQSPSSPDSWSLSCAHCGHEWQAPKKDVVLAAAEAAQVPEDMLTQYLATALWSSTDESSEDGGEPLDANHSVSDFDPTAVAQARADIGRFLTEAGHLLDGVEADDEQVGHDLWLTRNGHGAGFWDRPEMYKDKQTAEALAKIAHGLGESYPTVGDEGKIHFYGFSLSARRKVVADMDSPGVEVLYTMEDSQAARSHGYNEFDWEAYLTIDGRDFDEFTPEEVSKLQKIDAILKGESWTDGGAMGFFHVRVNYDDVRSADLEDFKDDEATKLAIRVEDLLTAEFGPEVNVDWA